MQRPTIQTRTCGFCGNPITRGQDSVRLELTATHSRTRKSWRAGWVGSLHTAPLGQEFDCFERASLIRACVDTDTLGEMAGHDPSQLRKVFAHHAAAEQGATA